jgi:iron complex outermembrane receptor protein
LVFSAQAVYAEGEVVVDALPADPTAVVELGEVIVTAPRTVAPLRVETDPKSPRQPVPPSDGAGYLLGIPGFGAVRKGGAGGDPVFRGQTGSRLTVVLDGSPLMGGCGMRMDPPTAYVYPQSYDSITVLKGPQSVVNGGGSAATVLFERHTERFAGWGQRSTATALVGSCGRNEQMVDAAMGGPPGYLRLIATRSTSDDYADGSGREIHSEYSRQSGSVIAGWTPDQRTAVEASLDISGAQAAYADRAMDGTAFDRGGGRVQYTRGSVSPRVHRIRVLGYYDYIDHVMDRFSLRPFTRLATAAPMAALNNPDRSSVGGRAVVELAPRDRITLSTGVDVNRDLHRKRLLSQAEYLAGDTDYRDKKRLRDLAATTYSGFAEGAKALSATTRWVGGYRCSLVAVSDEDAGNQPTDHEVLHHGFFRLESAVRWVVPFTAYAGVGHAERSADYWERSKDFALAPERTTQVDLGALRTGEHWQASVSLFCAQVKDYILLSATSGRNVDAVTIGGEAQLTGRIAHHWTGDLGLAGIRGENSSDHRPLAQVPPVEANLGLRYDRNRLLVGVHGRFVAGQKRVDVGWGTIAGQDIGASDGHTVLSANLGFRPGKGVVVSLGIDNLTDATYAEHLSRAASSTLAGAGYEQTVRVNEPGRTLWLTGTLAFQTEP